MRNPPLSCVLYICEGPSSWKQVACGVWRTSAATAPCRNDRINSVVRRNAVECVDISSPSLNSLSVSTHSTRDATRRTPQQGHSSNHKPTEIYSIMARPCQFLFVEPLLSRPACRRRSYPSFASFQLISTILIFLPL